MALIHPPRLGAHTRDMPGELNTRNTRYSPNQARHVLVHESVQTICPSPQSFSVSLSFLVYTGPIVYTSRTVYTGRILSEAWSAVYLESSGPKRRLPSPLYCLSAYTNPNFAGSACPRCGTISSTSPRITTWSRTLTKPPDGSGRSRHRSTCSTPGPSNH